MIIIDLSAPECNAFNLLKIAEELSNQYDYDYKKIKQEMTDKDWGNFVQTFLKYFGDKVQFKSN